MNSATHAARARTRTAGEISDEDLAELIFVYVSHVSSGGGNPNNQFHIALIGVDEPRIIELTKSLAQWLKRTLPGIDPGWVNDAFVIGQKDLTHLVVSVADLSVYGDDTEQHILTFVKEFLTPRTDKRIIVLGARVAFSPLSFEAGDHTLGVRLERGLSLTQPRTPYQGVLLTHAPQGAAHLARELEMVLDRFRYIERVAVVPTPDGIRITVIFCEDAIEEQILADRPDIERRITRVVQDHVITLDVQRLFAPARI